ncbi:MAG TPA: UdgX family uracil-DNA binding protein [Tepidisphaeraceae bacterium]|nr:UdgX family uracil-DNA binding protein [Tepidisphaeraceae bacterium]
MRQVRLEPDFASWRDAARELLCADIPPDRVVFVPHGLEHALLPNFLESIDVQPRSTPLRVPREFVKVAEAVACHTDEGNWATMYRVLWRLTHGEPHLLRVTIDDDVRALLAMEKQVRFDAHKMKAFVRFRLARGGGPAPGEERAAGEHYIAYHRSEHRVLKMTAPFFVRRFGVMRWSILTPFDSAFWDGEKLTFGPGVSRDAAPKDDELEALWRTYYASIFNPARVKLKAMHKEMPRRYWSTMPETQLIPELLLQAPRRAREMVAAHTDRVAGARAFFPATITLPQLREAAMSCRGCDLYCNATQTVFGEGPADAHAALVAEQPGDNEDLAGRPFVGPAGEVLNAALREVGLDRSQLYISGAVKHFKFEQRGTRRIHAKPNARQVQACRPWIEAELRLVRPRVLVLLGATAAQSLIGRHFKLTRDRGQPFESEWSPWTIATFHPSALLRIPDPALRARAQSQFVSDLRQAADRLALAQ